MNLPAITRTRVTLWISALLILALFEFVYLDATWRTAIAAVFVGLMAIIVVLIIVAARQGPEKP